MMKLKQMATFMVLFVAACSQNPGVTTVTWKLAGNLPAPEGYVNALGVSGAYAGIIGDKMVVAGGANFPNPWQLETGPQGKTFYPDIFVFDIATDGTLTQSGKGKLPVELASGIALADGEKLYFVGGENSSQDTASIYEVTLNGSDPIVVEQGKLPFTWSLGAAALYEGKIYLVAGRKNRTQGGGPTSEAWVYDLATKKATALAPFPGEARVQPPFALQDGKLYVFNGIGKLTFTDNYVYDIAANTWAKLADTTLKDVPFTVAGGAAIALNQNEIAVIGGVNKEIFDDASTQLGTLKDQELIDFRVKYFGMSPEDFKFSKELMIYNIVSNTWSSRGQLPFIGGAGPYPLIAKDDKIWHVSGEIKAAVRTPEIQVGIVK